MRGIKVFLVIAIAVTPKSLWALQGDLNNDGVVDISDFSILAEEWLISDEPIWALQSDINKDGGVSTYDYNLMFNTTARVSGL